MIDYPLAFAIAFSIAFVAAVAYFFTTIIGLLSVICGYQRAQVILVADVPQIETRAANIPQIEHWQLESKRRSRTAPARTAELFRLARHNYCFYWGMTTLLFVRDNIK